MRFHPLGTLTAALLTTSLGCAQSFHSGQFNGTHTQTYPDNTHRALPGGWTGRRDPKGDHKGTIGYTKFSGGVMSYRGGVGNSSDALHVWKSIPTVPADYRFQIRFRRDGDQSPVRATLSIQIGDFPASHAGIRFMAGQGASGNTGVIVGGTTRVAPFATAKGTWYVFEGINRSTGSEVRIWKDGNARPATPLVKSTGSKVVPKTFAILGSNYIAPQVSVDWFFIGPADMATLHVDKPNPTPGSTSTLTLTSPADAGRPYVAACALGDRPGIALGAGQIVPLNNDPMLVISLTTPAVFQGFFGKLDARGIANPKIVVPPIAAFRGVRFFAGGVVTDATAPGGVRRIANSMEILIQ